MCLPFALTLAGIDVDFLGDLDVLGWVNLLLLWRCLVHERLIVWSISQRF
jgi:hypothetical protein